MKNNAKYWEKRILEDKKKAIDAEKKIQKQLNKIYKDTFKELEKDIMTLFQKYADDNELTYSDAIKYLTSKEFSEWRMDLKEYLNEVEKTADPKLLLELNTLAMKSRISRLEQLTYQVNKQLNKCFTYSNDIVKELLEKSVMNAYSDSAKNVNYAYGIEATKSIAKERVTKILIEPWSGANFSENIWSNRDKLAGVVRNELTKGIYQGKSSQKICNEISKRMEGSKDDIMRVVRTERSHAVNKAKLEQYKDTGFEYYKYKAAVGQNRTCERCRKVHKESEKEPIKLSEAVEGENFPPLHPNCRCTVVPYMKDDEIVDKNKINDKDVRAINKYISSQSYILNYKLRNNIKLDEYEKELIKDIDNAIMKLDKYEGEVYRSLSFQFEDEYEKFVKEHKDGEIIMYKAYTSSSTEIYDDSMEVQMIIKSKKGRDMRSFTKNEKEVLFPRNTKFIVEKVEGDKIWLKEI